MKEKKSFKIQNIIKIGIAIIIVFIMLNVITLGQSIVSRNNQYEDSMETLENISTTLNSNETTAEVLTSIYHLGNVEILEDLKQLIESKSKNRSVSEATELIKDTFEGLLRKSFDPYIFLLDKDGNTIVSADEGYESSNLINIGFFSDDQFDILKQGSTTGLLCDIEDVGEYYFYAISITFNSEECYLVLGNLNDIFERRVDALTDLGEIVDDLSLTDNEFIFTVYTLDNTISFCSNESLNFTNKKTDDVGIPQSALIDKSEETVNINGNEYFLVALSYSDDMVLVHAVSTSVWYSDNFKPTLWAMIIFVMALAIMAIYAQYLPGDLTKRKKKQNIVHLFHSKVVINLTVVSKIIPLMVLTLALIFGAVFYCRTVMRLSMAMNEVESPLAQLDYDIAESLEDETSLQEYSDQMYLSKVQMLATMLEMDPSCLNEETDKVYTEYTDSGEKVKLIDDEGNPMLSVANSEKLQELCDKNDIKSIFIFNDRGYTICSNNESWYFSLSLNAEDQSYAFRDVLDGKKDFFVQEEQTDDEGNTNQYIGVAFNYYTTTDDDGSTIYVSSQDYQNYLEGNWSGNDITAHHSLLQCAANTSILQGMKDSMNINYIMEHVILNNDAHMVVFDNSSDHVIIYSPIEENLDKKASDVGISDKVFSGTYNGFLTVQGVKYFECCRYNNGYYVSIATPLSSLYSTRLTVTVTITISCLIAMILLMGLFLITGEKNMEWMKTQLGNQTEPEKKAENDLSEEDEKEDDIKTAKNANFNPKQSWKQKWNQHDADEKLRTMIHIGTTIIGLYFLFGLLFNNQFFADSIVIKYVFSDSWDRGLNIFAITKSVVVFIAVLVAVDILRWFVRLITAVFSSRTETITNLLMSFIKYGGVIGTVFYCMYLFGLQPISLLASAGVLSVVLGFGAQNLIADLLAGISIVFEGSFHVGDCVSIDNKWGIVQEIGIRTTKIRDFDNDILVYNNSSIKSILNASIKVARIRMVLKISYGESLERVEQILDEELPLFKQKIPGIKDGPYYTGVSNISDGTTDIRLLVTCKGDERMSVTRHVNRELVVMCERRGIHIPYKHVTVVYEDEK